MKRLKALWLCNIVLPEFSDFFGFKPQHHGGWMSGTYNVLKTAANIEFGFVFPVFKEERMLDGQYDNAKVYSFLRGEKEPYIDYDENMVLRFVEILNDFKPDVVNIWGTEYPHSSAMFEAAKRVAISDKVVIDIQGVVSIYAKHYFIGFPPAVSEQITDGKDTFDKNGIPERRLISECKNFMVRTDWDTAVVKQINPQANLFYSPEALRGEFYENASKWNINIA